VDDIGILEHIQDEYDCLKFDFGVLAKLIPHLGAVNVDTSGCLCRWARGQCLKEAVRRARVELFIVSP